jgi:hypothetical protein
MSRIGVKRDLYCEIRPYLNQFLFNQSQNNFILCGKFKAIRSETLIFIDFKLRELSRFSLSFTLSIGGFAVVFGRNIERRGRRREYLGSGALLRAPSSTLKSLNNKQIFNRGLFAWFCRILRDFERKTLKNAKNTRIFYCLSLNINRTGFKEYLEIKQK